MKTKPLQSVFQFVFVVTLASAIAMGINGCASTNTRESTGQFVDDSAITTKIKAKLVDDPMVSALRISVETYQGVVQLSGFANSRAEIRQAGEIAKQTDGVRSVKNNIQLK
jgi:osmotically-inducible protein OsmY